MKAGVSQFFKHTVVTETLQQRELFLIQGLLILLLLVDFFNPIMLKQNKTKA